jgi:uncharacterized protein
MRLVLDTNVVASAMLWGGLPLRLLQAGREGRVELFTSAPLIAELTDILGRRKFEAKIAASKLSVDQLVDGYLLLAGLVRPSTLSRIAPDPDDDVVIGTGVAVKADFIVTGDRALLSVIEYDGVGIVETRRVLQLLDAV